MATFLPPTKAAPLPKTSGKCIARMTVTRDLGNVTIVEIYDSATFHSFYWYWTQIGRRRSTKRLVRTASRNEGLRPYAAAYRMQPGLEVLAENWKKQPGVKSVKVRIIRKRVYKRLCTMAPDQLGLTRVYPGFAVRRPSPVSIPMPSVTRLPIVTGQR